MAGDGKSTRSEKDPQSLVADLLRRVTAPEVLAGVAGAGAAAYFTKHMVEDSDETDAEGQPEDTAEEDKPDENEPDDDEQEDPEAAGGEGQSDGDDPDEDELEEPEAGGEQEEPEAGGERQEPEAGGEQEEPEADEGKEGEPRAAEDSPEDLDEAESDGDEQPEPTEDEGDEAPDEPADSNGSLGSDDERMQLLDRARRYTEQLTGHPVEGFSSVEQEDRGWRVGVEVVELARVPSTTDVLASYELVLTTDGEFVDFRRGHRYFRNSTDDAS